MASDSSVGKIPEDPALGGDDVAAGRFVDIALAIWEGRGWRRIALLGRYLKTRPWVVTT